MNIKYLDFCFRLDDPGRLLLWIMSFCLLGTVVTVWAMIVTSRFFFKYEPSKEDKLFRPLYSPFSIIGLELPVSFERFKILLSKLTASTKATIRMQLKFDYYFMVFFYMFWFFAGCFIVFNTSGYQDDKSKWTFLWMPLFAWLLDFYRK